MEVNVILGSTLKQCTSKASEKVCINADKNGIQESCLVQDIINELKLSQDEIGVIIVNKKIETSNAVVYHGDVVEFYPLFGGG